MLDRIDHGRQPAESHLPAVAAPLPRGGSRHRCFIQPDIRHVELLIEVAGMPAKGQLHRHFRKCLRAVCRPAAVGDEIGQAEQFTPAPDPR